MDGENAREALSTAIQLFRYETKHTLSFKMGAGAVLLVNLVAKLMRFDGSFTMFFHFIIDVGIHNRASTHPCCMLVGMRIRVHIECPSADGAKALLDPPVIKHEGIVPWWRYRRKQESLGVERWCPPDAEDGEINSRLHFTRCFLDKQSSRLYLKLRLQVSLRTQRDFDCWV